MKPQPKPAPPIDLHAHIGRLLASHENERMSREEPPEDQPPAEGSPEHQEMIGKILEAAEKAFKPLVDALLADAKKDAAVAEAIGRLEQVLNRIATAMEHSRTAV